MEYIPGIFIASIVIFLLVKAKKEKIEIKKKDEENEVFFIRLKQVIPQCMSIESYKDSACGSALIINYFDFDGKRHQTAIVKACL